MSTSVLDHTDQVEATLARLPPGGPSEETARRFIRAVANVSPDLLPPRLCSPLASEIARGPDAYPGLLERLETADEVRGSIILDAIGTIARDHGAPESVIVRLRVLARAEAVALSVVATRALAWARDPETLETQRALLHSKSRTVQRAAVRLIGYGRYVRALPDLLVLLRPNQPTLADLIIWALGEIGDPDVLPTLHAVLADNFMTRSVLEAIGKIADVSSFAVILPFLAGATDERAAAAAAISRISLFDSGAISTPLRARARTALARVVRVDESRLARYHAVVALARLGFPLPVNRVMQAVGAPMATEQLDPMAAFFTR